MKNRTLCFICIFMIVTFVNMLFQEKKLLSKLDYMNCKFKNYGYTVGDCKLMVPRLWPLESR